MLRYTGGGYGGWLPGVPARDLNDDEVEELGGMDALLATGLYERVTHGSFGAVMAEKSEITKEQVGYRSDDQLSNGKKRKVRPG